MNKHTNFKLLGWLQAFKWFQMENLVCVYHRNISSEETACQYTLRATTTKKVHLKQACSKTSYFCILLILKY